MNETADQTTEVSHGTCKAVRRRIFRYCIKDVPSEERAEMDKHFADCDTCKTIAHALENSLMRGLRAGMQKPAGTAR